MLSTEDLRILSGTPSTTMDDRISTGLLTPDVKGKPGTGRGHRFSLTRGVGYAIACALMRADRAGVRHGKAIVDAFATLAEADLAAALGAGRTHFLGLRAGVPVLGQAVADEVDVKAVFEAVKAAAKGI